MEDLVGECALKLKVKCVFFIKKKMWLELWNVGSTMAFAQRFTFYI